MKSEEDSQILDEILTKDGFDLSFPSTQGNDKPLIVNQGEILFLLGANGTGKSSLLHLFHNKTHTNNVLRINAHRQIWLDSHSLTIDPSINKSHAHNISSSQKNPQGRYQDLVKHNKHQYIFNSVLHLENMVSRRASDAIRRNDLEEAKVHAKDNAPITILNDILNTCNLDLEINIHNNNSITACRNGSENFNIQELSDGERNAILIICEVLTADEKSLILIDEPERHLHRSIVSPLLNSLLLKRNDCAFVIATHDVSIPIGQDEASILLLRSYSHKPQQWSTDYIENIDEMDENTKETILGSRRRILFIEGDTNSLDYYLYSILFADVSIHPTGGCGEVERIVKGIRLSKEKHWIDAYGVVDRDNRTDEESEELRSFNIASLDQYSVEAIYYHPTVYQSILKIQSEDPADDENRLNDKIIESFREHKDRIVLNLVTKKISDSIIREIPGKNKIKEIEKITISKSVKEIKDQETALISELIQKRDVTGLLVKYPLKETPIQNYIAKGMGYSSSKEYESKVRALVKTNEDVKQSILKLVNPISEILSVKK